MKRLAPLFAATLVLLLTACAPRVYVEQDSNAQFTNLHTFAWVTPPIGKIKDPILNSEILEDRVQRATVANLTARGFTETSLDQNPDFIVTYHIVGKTQLQSSGGSFSFGFFSAGPGRFGSISTGNNVQTQEQGTLMLDITDGHSKKLMWRGWTNDVVNQDNYSEQAITKTVNAILAKFHY
ncbi:MAG: DUF4136 domain-containing protein [Gammaproteobacteria bacterium]